MAQTDKSIQCPCGKGTYRACCGTFHFGGASAPTAELLMRSRYSAYALGLGDYLMQTWHVSTRPESMDLSAETRNGKWIGLAVKASHEADNKAEVEFVARYKPHAGPASRLHERSRFVKECGQWFYVDGDLYES